MTFLIKKIKHSYMEVKPDNGPGSLGTRLGRKGVCVLRGGGWGGTGRAWLGLGWVNCEGLKNIFKEVGLYQMA